MKYDDWFVAIFAGVAVVALAWSWTPWARGIARWQVPIARGLPLPESIRSFVTSRLLARMRFIVILGTIAFVGSHLILRNSGYRYTSGDFYLCLSIFGLATGVAVVLAASGQQLARPQTSIRLARLRTTVIDDYIPRSHRVVAWITVSCVAVAVTLNDVALFTSGGLPLTSPQLFSLVVNNLIAVFTLTAMVVFEIAGRAIVDRPQPAGSSEELVWDDVLRASALRELIQVPIIVGAYGFIFGYLREQNGDHGPLNIIAFALIAPVIVGYFISQWMLRDSREHYLRRLWPNGPLPDDPGADAVAVAFGATR